MGKINNAWNRLSIFNFSYVLHTRTYKFSDKIKQKLLKKKEVEFEKSVVSLILSITKKEINFGLMFL